MNIRKFLEARIAEDEAVARAATDGPWRYDPRKVWHQDAEKLAMARAGNPFVTGGEEFVAAGPDDGRNETTIGVAVTGPEDHPQSMADAAHIARHDPARVLAECAAKRAIITEHGLSEVASLDRETWGRLTLICRTCAVGPRQVVAPCPTLRHLAAMYADHPDYNTEWAVA